MSDNGKATGNLAGALAKAQQKCQAAPHDAQNSFHKYQYTSSEAVIAEAKRALSGCGLALVPVASTIQPAGEGLHERQRSFLLLHESGESVEIRQTWPVVPDRGRPLDKAVASADTTSLAYLLRDLLLMPRVDEADDMNARDDTKHAPQPRQQKPPAKPEPQTAKSPPVNGAADEFRTVKEKLAEVHRRLEAKKKTWAECFRHFGIACEIYPQTPLECEKLAEVLSGDEVNTLYHGVTPPAEAAGKK